MEYDIIFVMGEIYFDHPLCGVALLKRLLEKNHYKVGVIEKPIAENELKSLGKPRLFFAVTSGAIDSMIRNYTPLKKKRSEDEYNDYDEEVPDRAVTVYCNWLKKNYKDVPIVIGGTEATLRRFVHYDYWQNRLRKSILLDSRANLLVYGCGEKQILETASRIKNGKSLEGIEGTCIIS
ncbi:MAG: YgiQ family radical SAM protein, partial [Nanoarchaeota archaeon]|nr:YgiQ family radical SAM protein [Nanoarchaeota archaeon]